MMIQWNIYIVYNWCEMIIEDLQRLGSCCTYLLHDMIARLDGDGMHPYLTTHSSTVPFAYKPSPARMAASPLAPRVSMRPAESKHGRPSPSSSSSQGQATCVLHSKALQGTGAHDYACVDQCGDPNATARKFQTQNIWGVFSSANV